MTLQPSEHELARQQTDALPRAGDGNGQVITDNREALLYFEQLVQSGSTLPEHLLRQAHELTAEEHELLESLGYDLPELLLQGIVTRAVHASAAQVIKDTGSAALEVKQLEEILGSD